MIKAMPRFSRATRGGAVVVSINKRNVDTRVMEISRSDLRYKLLVVPGVVLMDEATANKIREFVRSGGTAAMTGYSSMVGEHNQVFATTLPGRLSDVFDRLAINTGPKVPVGVMVRQIDRTHVLYLNLDGSTKHVELKGSAKSILRDKA